MADIKNDIEKLDGKTEDIVAQNIEQLKALFPSVFSEGKIQFNKLEELLGNYVVEDEEHYNFTWHGKRKAGRLAQTPSTGTLRPCKDESVDWDTTENLFIEGDNLEVLKLLQKSYHRKVKMIYIDPPYNTGNDFVYKDDFKDGVKNYLEITGQVDGDGKKVRVNPDTDGRYHTNWLNMMYPRLKLARNLLKDDGVIFISIDDDEQSNLKKVCDEVFGEENFINQISLNAKVSAGASGGGEDRKLKKNIEYILMYSKSYSSWQPINPIYKETKLVDYIDQMKKDKKSFKYTNVLYRCENLEPFKMIKDGNGGDINIIKVNDYEIKTVKQVAKLENISEAEVFANYHELIMTTTNAQTSIRDRVWEATDSENNMYIAEYTPKSGKNKGKMTKLYFMGKQKVLMIWLKDSSIKVGDDIYKREKVGTYWDGFSWINVTKEGNIKFPNGKKPVALIEQFMKLIPDNEDMLILDFFAGSGSTAHAVMNNNLSRSDKSNYISVHLPEKIEPTTKENKDYLRYLEDENVQPVVTDVAKERIRRASKKIKQENSDYHGDLGFKVFKLDSSNIKRWDASFDTLESDLVDAVDYLVKGRTDEDVLYELCLKLGLDLSIKIEEKIITDNGEEKKLFILGRGYLVVCLDDAITMDVINGIGALKGELAPEDGMRVVFKDDGFKDDVVKTNALQTLKRLGINDIKSL